MPEVSHGRRVVLHISPGCVLSATADANGEGRVGRLADGVGAAVPDVPRTFDTVARGHMLNKGPFTVTTRWWLESVAGAISYTVDDGSPGDFVP